MPDEAGYNRKREGGHPFFGSTCHEPCRLVLRGACLHPTSIGDGKSPRCESWRHIDRV